MSSNVSTKSSLPCFDDIIWLRNNIDIIEPCLDKRLNILTSELSSFHNSGGLSSNMSKLLLELDNQTKLVLILKTVFPSRLPVSKELGLARESLFYEQTNDFPILQSCIPKVYYTYGSMETGEKFILLEYLSNCVQVGYLCGPGSPLNWNKDIDELTISARNHYPMFDEEALLYNITLQIFRLAANIHGTYWEDKNLLHSLDWLRGRQWILQEDQESWNRSQNHALELWNKTKANMSLSHVHWNQHVIDCMDSSFDKISWTNYFKGNNKNRSWTLVHSDFHPANIMLDYINKKLYFVDWEVVGIGNGPQDLAQYMISHINPNTRRKFEQSLIQEYFFELQKHNIYMYTFEDCWDEYISGGCGRWVWMLALLSSMCTDDMVQYFHDQFLAFIMDHEVTSTNISMPRV